MTQRSPGRGDALLLGAFLLSGTAGLSYELLWTRILSIGLGSEVLAVFGVLAGFFWGMAIGAFALQPLTRRVRYPLLLFAILEMGAAAYAIVSPRLLHAAADILPRLTNGAQHGGVMSLAASVALAAGALLPGTICLGGTLAAVVEAHHRRRREDDAGQTLGRLYGANTLGAALGTLAAVYVVMPLLGFHWASMALALIGLCAAALALLWGSRTPAPETTKPAPQSPVELRRWGRIGLHALIFGTGFVGVGFEVIGVRIISQGLENTVFTFANILAIYLLGTSAGAWSYAKVAPRLRARRFHDVLTGLLLSLAVSVCLAAAATKLGPSLLTGIAPANSSYERQLLAEIIVAATIFGLPTMLMGALFSHIVAALSDRATGHAYGFNTIGGTLAPFIFGVVAIPALGYTTTFYLVGYAYLLLFCIHALVSGRRRLWIAAGILVVVSAEALAPSSLSLAHPPEGWRVLNRHEGLFGAVSVLQRKGGDSRERRLQLGQSSPMDARRIPFERRMGQISALLAPQHRRALFLGIGSGAGLRAARQMGVDELEAVELVPEIVAALPYFHAAHGGIDHDPQVKIHVADTRRFVATSTQRFDMVTASPCHPGRDGAAGLFSLEHFSAIKRRLQPRGVFVQWLPIGQMAPETLRTIGRTFLTVFPLSHAFLLVPSADYPLLALAGYNPAQKEGLALPLVLIQRALKRSSGEGTLDRAEELFGAYLLGPAGLARFVAGAALNTDLDPRILFDAPRAAHTKGAPLAHRSLSALLQRAASPPSSLFVAPPAELSRFVSRARLYTRAARRYVGVDLERLRSGAKQHGRGAMDALLAAYEADPTFAPARAALLTLAQREPARAEAIFARMLTREPGAAVVAFAYAAYLRGIGKSARALDVEREMRQALPHKR
ncbi:MAG: hypothetical protein JRH20_12795 [Deltaproteobacteria bacterium]|nr:hypothetical protein [Deltaproteobacteria bacterium]